jgi:murein DD-endopeptidase MepM/ murein hydrolase activator NlpD
VRLRRAVAPLVLLLVLATLPLVASAQSQSQLADARARVRDVTAQIEDAKGDTAAARAALAEADRRLAEVEEAVNEAVAAVERQEVEVAQAAEQLAAMQAEDQSLRSMLEERAIDLFKNGSGLSIEVLLTSGGVDEALERSSFLRVITAADRDTLEALQASTIRLDAERDRFEAERARLLDMQAEQEALLAEVEALRSARAAAVADAERRVARLEEQKDDLEADVARVSRLIQQRRVTPVSSSAPSTSGYAWPRCARVTSEYGRRWGRLHAGIDIDGNTGDAIAASKDGVVIFAGWSGGYGQLTLVDHGDGVVTAYAHQSSIAVREGQRVARGERIGAVGSTGNSTGAHLHFETRVNGAAVNPRRFLPRGC